MGWNCRMIFYFFLKKTEQSVKKNVLQKDMQEVDVEWLG